MRQLAWRDARELLRQLGPVAEQVVLVGGQAVAFWAERYLDRIPELVANESHTSKDIDFAGGPSDVTAMAARVQGRYSLTLPFEDASPHAGVVFFPAPSGEEYPIDVLRVVHGLDVQELNEFARSFEDDDGTSVVRFRVMHPVHSLESRTYNTAELPGYTTLRAIQQLRASVLCAREFLRELVDEGEVRAVLKLNERIFRFRRYTDVAKKVLRDHGIDIFDAVLVDPRLPEPFRSIRYPQMRRDLGLDPS